MHPAPSATQDRPLAIAPSLSNHDLPDPPTLERLSCAVETTLDVVGGRWKVLILRELLVQTHRFAELQRALTGITQKMLTQQLRELEADGIVHRQVYAQVPPKVEYSLTELGRSLRPVLNAMHDWGLAYRQAHAPSEPARGDELSAARIAPAPLSGPELG